MKIERTSFQFGRRYRRNSQGSVLAPLLFLIYVNDLANGLSSNTKLFADDTSLFSVIHDIKATANELNNNLTKINS